jgi:hypothetical protein
VSRLKESDVGDVASVRRIPVTKKKQQKRKRKRKKKRKEKPTKPKHEIKKGN